jgi:hypothetical protein
MRLRYFPFHRCRVQRSIHLSSAAFHPDVDYDSVGSVAAETPIDRNALARSRKFTWEGPTLVR